jgi:acyl carrier protein
MTLKENLQTFINKDLLSGQLEVGMDDDLLMDGIVDSMGIMRLISHIEESIGFQVPPEDFTIENFGSINAMNSYLTAKANITP